MAEELSEERLLVALETLELAAAAGRAQRQHNLERKTRLAHDEQLELRVLRRHAACLEPLRRFEAAAEAVGGRARPSTPLGGVPAGRCRQRGTGAAPRDRRLPGGGRRRRWRARQVALHVAARLVGCPREVRRLLWRGRTSLLGHLSLDGHGAINAERRVTHLISRVSPRHRVVAHVA